MDAQVRTAESSVGHGNKSRAGGTNGRAKSNESAHKETPVVSDFTFDQEEPVHTPDVANGAANLVAANVIPSIEACLSLLGDWRHLAVAAASQVEEDMEAIKEGWQQISACNSPGDYARIGSELRDKLTQQCAKSSQRMAALAGEYATRRWQASATLPLSRFKLTK